METSNVLALTLDGGLRRMFRNFRVTQSEGGFEIEVQDGDFRLQLTAKEGKLLLVTSGADVTCEERPSDARYLIAPHVDALAVTDVTEELQKRLSQSVDIFCFGPRTAHCLWKERILYVGDLVEKREKDLMHIRNFGSQCLGEVTRALEKRGFRLGMMLQGWVRPEDGTLTPG